MLEGPESKATGYFLDSSDLKEISRWRSVITGVTTNPVILEKEGVVDIPSRIGEICALLGPGVPVSVEIPDSHLSTDEMVELGEAYADRYPHNAVVKVPIVPGVKGLDVLSKLNKKNIVTNATLGITFAQLAMAADAGANYISLFWGRAEESREKYSEGPGARIILESILAYLVTRNHTNVRVIVGSIRTAEQVREAFAIGAHIVTVTPAVMDSSMNCRRLDETISQFDLSYENSKKNPQFRLI